MTTDGTTMDLATAEIETTTADRTTVLLEMAVTVDKTMVSDAPTVQALAKVLPVQP